MRKTFRGKDGHPGHFRNGGARGFRSIFELYVVRRPWYSSAAEVAMAPYSIDLRERGLWFAKI
jgi:hypothetical protein